MLKTATAAAPANSASDSAQSFMLSENADDLAKRYLIEELGIPADIVKDAGQNLIGFFAKLHAIQQRLETETQPTV